jgi:hypothetical protein
VTPGLLLLHDRLGMELLAMAAADAMKKIVEQWRREQAQEIERAPSFSLTENFTLGEWPGLEMRLTLVQVYNSRRYD